MNFFTLFVILTVIIGLSQSFRLNSVEENINEDRIVGGKTARSGQFPYQASLRTLRKVNGTLGWFGYRCGGSIISRRWILTVAHCTQDFFSNPSRVAVAVSAHHIQDDGKIYLLDRIVNHPEFDESMHRADISLMRTTCAINFSDAVQLIPLRRRFVAEGTAATVSGWGAIRVRRKWNNKSFMCLVDVDG